jgi:hypothetical protein
MRKFIGHQMRFIVDGHKVEGEFLGEGAGDEKGLLLVRSAEDNTITRIPKGKIGPFTYADQKDETTEYVPFLVLRCFNRTSRCPGVQFIKEGPGFRPGDFEVFMGECPCRDDSCSHGSAGELRSVTGGLLRDMLADTRFGEYPERKKNASSGTASRKTQRSPVKNPDTSG